jgi:hypothetical protein
VCTLLLGWRVPGASPLLLAANRDEDPTRPSDGPRVLHHSPRVVGGRDRRGGGTWLAVRDRRAIVAILNRRPAADAQPPPSGRVPSRGLLALDVAAAGDGHPRSLAAAARLLLATDAHAPCSLVIAGPEAAFVVHHRGGREAVTIEIAPGWHVITHEDLDDREEPRTRWLLGELDGFAPHSTEAAFERLERLLASHGAEGRPPVCLHAGRMVTVSTARVVLGRDEARYLHGEGFGCEATLVDHSPLLE